MLTSRKCRRSLRRCCRDRAGGPRAARSGTIGYDHLVRFDAVLRTFSDFFEQENIRYAIIGGLALQAWGHTRFTRDIDFVVERAARDRVLRFAEEIGYETLHVSEGYSNHLHADPDRGRVDFMYVDEATAARIFADAERKPIAGDFAAPVPRPEHLLAMKAISMKNSPHRVLIDSPDVAFLLRLPNVDREAVREYFTRHGLLELFDAIERQSRSR